MKNQLKKMNIGFTLLLLISLTCCVEDDNFNIPPLNIVEPDIDGIIIEPGAVVGLLNQAITQGGEDAKITFADSNNYMVGYVVSDDSGGNFFEELIIQDAAINPKTGLRLRIDVNPLFTTYEFGCKVFIKLDGLSVGIQNGVPSLGVLSGNQIENIPSFSEKEFIIRSAEVSEINPLPVAMGALSDNFLNLFIKIENVQFNRKQVLGTSPTTFAAEATDEFSGERLLESCVDGGSVILRTSTFSDFRGVLLPDNQGTFQGILSKDFFGEKLTVILNDPTGLVFDNDTRCDPNVLECEGEITTNTTIFEENFSNKSINDLETEGWINENTTGGRLTYSIGGFGGNQFAQVSGFNSDESEFDVWLITPPIDLGITTAASLSFDIQASFDNGTILTPLITNNFTGDPTTTEWIGLDTVVPKGIADGFGDFETLGPISISCLQGTVRIAFKYSGSDPNATTRYGIDTVKVVGE